MVYTKELVCTDNPHGVYKTNIVHSQHKTSDIYHNIRPQTSHKNSIDLTHALWEFFCKEADRMYSKLLTIFYTKSTAMIKNVQVYSLEIKTNWGSYVLSEQAQKEHEHAGNTNKITLITVNFSLRSRHPFSLLSPYHLLRRPPAVVAAAAPEICCRYYRRITEMGCDGKEQLDSFFVLCQLVWKWWFPAKCWWEWKSN